MLRPCTLLRPCALLMLAALAIGSEATAPLSVSTVKTAVLDRIFHRGDAVRLEVTLVGALAAQVPESFPIEVRQMRNYLVRGMETGNKPGQFNYESGCEQPGQVVERLTATVRRDGNTTVVVIVSAAPLLGAFQATAMIGSSSVVLAEWLHVLPPDPAVTPANTRFSANCYWQQGHNRMLPRFARLGVKMVRDEWSMEYTADGAAFDWRKPDQAIAELRANDMGMFLIVGHHADARWLRLPSQPDAVIHYNGGPPETQPAPRDMDEFAAWCGGLAKRATGVIRAYEFFNEPWETGSISGASGGGAQVRRLVAAGVPAIRAVDPTARMLAGGSIPNAMDSLLPYPETMELLDGLSSHTWFIWNSAEQAVAKRSGKEVWDTESWSQIDESHHPFKVAHQLHLGLRMNNLIWSGMHFTDAQRPWTAGTALWVASQRLLDAMEPAGAWSAPAIPHALFFTGRGRAVAYVGGFPVQGTGFDCGGGIHDQGQRWRQLLSDVLHDPDQPIGTWTIPANGLEALDVFGNPLSVRDGKIALPIGRFGCYLVAKEVSVMRAALDAGALAGIAPAELLVEDLREPVKPGAVVRVTVTNPYPSTETLALTLGGALAAAPQSVELKAGERREIAFVLTTAVVQPTNRYRLTIGATGRRGEVVHETEISALVIARGTPLIDGQMTDWDTISAVPIILVQDKEANNRVAEYQKLDFITAVSEENRKAYLVEARAAWDDTDFYLAARINDPTESRPASLAYGTRHETWPWPNQHIYLRMPELSGCFGDILQLAFGQGAADAHWDWPAADGPLAHFYPRPTTGYELQVHAVRAEPERDAQIKRMSPNFTGMPTSEVWMLKHPQLPFWHHAYPLNPPSVLQKRDQGLVRGARSVVERTATGWIYEVAVPWTAIGGKPTDGSMAFTLATRNDGGPAVHSAAGRDHALVQSWQMHPMWEAKPTTCTRWGLAP